MASGGERTLDCELRWHSKFYNYVILFIGYKLVVSKLFNKILIYRKGSYVDRFWVCTFFYRPLFLSL